MSIRVAELWIYPIKSCSGVRQDMARVTPTGLEYDRQWMVVDAEGRFLTQRKNIPMALVRVAVQNDELVVSHDDNGTLSMPINSDGEQRTVTVWDDTVASLDMGDAPAEWFSTLLSEPVRLVRMASSKARTISEKYHRQGRSASVSFADGYGALLTSMQSLRHLNAHLPEPVPMNRFRPNIVLDGSDLDAYAEDVWDELQIGAIQATVVKPSARCEIVDTDQSSGERQREVRRALKATRNGTRKLDGKPGLFFGQNLALSENGMVRVGDELRVMTTLAQPNVVLKV